MRKEEDNVNIFNGNCMNYFKEFDSNSIDLTLTDIPYGKVNRESNGLRNLNKKNADIETFDLLSFLDEVHRTTKGTIIIFCGNEQYSTIYDYFNKKKGTVRQLIWAKNNPSPMNGQYIYLNGTENAIWFKKRGSTFNAHCKKNVFNFPCGRSKLHPTEKNHNLLKELILDNSNEGDLVFDPCCGSGSHLLVAKQLNRRYFGIELNKKYYDVSKQRLLEEQGNE